MNVARTEPHSAQRLIEELSTVDRLNSIQEQLLELQERLSAEEDTASWGLDSSEVARLVKEILLARRRRERIFGSTLFGEPVWDILLELYSAKLTQQKMCVSSACYSTAVPPTTALRWLQRLEHEGWVERKRDNRDGRRVFIELADKATAAMDRYFREIPIRPV